MSSQPATSVSSLRPGSRIAPRFRVDAEYSPQLRTLLVRGCPARQSRVTSVGFAGSDRPPLNGVYARRSLCLMPIRRIIGSSSRRTPHATQESCQPLVSGPPSAALAALSRQQRMHVQRPCSPRQRRRCFDLLNQYEHFRTIEKPVESHRGWLTRVSEPRMIRAVRTAIHAVLAGRAGSSRRWALRADRNRGRAAPGIAILPRSTPELACGAGSWPAWQGMPR